MVNTTLERNNALKAETIKSLADMIPELSYLTAKNELSYVTEASDGNQDVVSIKVSVRKRDSRDAYTMLEDLKLAFEETLKVESAKHGKGKESTDEV